MSKNVTRLNDKMNLYYKDRVSCIGSLYAFNSSAKFRNIQKGIAITVKLNVL